MSGPIGRGFTAVDSRVAAGAGTGRLLARRLRDVRVPGFPTPRNQLGLPRHRVSLFVARRYRLAGPFWPHRDADHADHRRRPGAASLCVWDALGATARRGDGADPRALAGGALLRRPDGLQPDVPRASRTASWRSRSGSPSTSAIDTSRSTRRAFTMGEHALGLRHGNPRSVLGGRDGLRTHARGGPVRPYGGGGRGGPRRPPDGGTVR